MSAVCHAAVAVVDRLPGSSTHVMHASKSGLDPAAYEGISVYFNETNSEDIEDIKQYHQRGRSLDSSHSASISFTFKDEDVPAPGSRSVISRAIQVPLANTLFQTGNQSTLSTSKWVLQPGSSGFSCLEKSEPASLAINLPGQSTTAELAKTTYNVPIFAVTPPRELGAAMGNIIRQLIFDKSVPASEELERALTEYFASQKLPQQALSVWALVIPRAVFSQLKEGQGPETSSDTIFQPAEPFKTGSDSWEPLQSSIIGTYIEAGAHMHRVLSGGGGWGQKRGLLSLDPHVSYNPEEEHSWSGQIEERFSEPKELAGVASPGDFIQFFVSPTNLSTPLPANDPGDNSNLAGDSLQRHVVSSSLVFGTTFSAIDETPTTWTSEASQSGQSDLIVSPHFGALSQQGISLKIERVSTSVPRSESRVVCQTKLDVPCMRLNRVTYNRKGP
ncbi:hypothetical protein L228DRAFT_122023 [Xylona heveae TC161]|uniref:Uncharacterized protein n=1 Tax=Xylona heveae (strain CBS 132557 / TC161) TaxID=1328760 RepID=A0A165HKU1_XYLHT|nr:hypothetical protein L228DRAFT_122023 [Xylona heveae TC161]KZF23664.1 hypothetical protein L228DRAFT_122023 [Xylona heveae TC161]